MPDMRDHREITVAGEARSARPAARRAAPRPAAGRSEWRAFLGVIAGGAWRLCRRKPGTLFGGALALAAVVAVSMNALGFQVGRHPAPILPKIAIRPDAMPKNVAERTVADKVVAEKAAEPARPAEAAHAPARTAEAAKPAGRDPIADLIRSGETTASVTPKPPAAPKPQASVMQAQKALAKLGYGPLKADGLMGAGTRTAIEKFERDRKLPVTGEAGGRTLRELAARAALPPA